MKIEANCKINIGLDILRRREDGFHELSTVMYPVRGLSDQITIEPSDTDSVEFTSSGLVIDCPPEHNIIIKAYNLIRSRCNGVGGVKIHLHKCVPFGAGLGGGSSDATMVLVAINQIFSLNLSELELIDLAAEIGSDTPFFVRNTPQLCSGRGEIMEPIELSLKSKWLVLIKPQVDISTKQAYSGVKPAEPQTPLKELIKLPIEQWQGRIKNDFEHHTFEIYPELQQIIDALKSAGAIYTSMSGSGSTLFGIFDSEEQARNKTLEEYTPYIYRQE